METIGSKLQNKTAATKLFKQRETLSDTHGVEWKEAQHFGGAAVLTRAHRALINDFDNVGMIKAQVVGNLLLSHIQLASAMADHALHGVQLRRVAIHHQVHIANNQEKKKFKTGAVQARPHNDLQPT